MRSKVRSEVISADSSATRYEVSDWDFNRRNQTCPYREKSVWMSTWILIEEIEQLFLEKWSDWKSSFSKTNGNFSASPVYQGADKREKRKDFSMEYPLERKGFRYGPGWKKWSVFFMDKKELQLQWILILFVRLLNVKIPKCYVPADRFSNKLCLFSSRRE